MWHALCLSSTEDLCPCTYCKSLPPLNRGQATKIHPAIFVEKTFSTEAGFVFFGCTSTVSLLGLSFVIDFRFNVPVFNHELMIDVAVLDL